MIRDDEIETLRQLRDRLGAGRGLAGCYLQSLDLTDLTAELAATAVARAVFLGCTFAAGAEADLEARGALVFPRLPDLPFDPYRSGLYRADELYRDLEHGYRYTLDARVYRWWRYLGTTHRLADELACSLHDHAISDALSEAWPDDAGSAVGVMGGHALARDVPGFLAAARLGRRLAEAGHPVITGGGPGAMEAANLGAALVGSERDLDHVVTELAAVPEAVGNIDAWAASAMSVREHGDFGRPSFGIPTWYYGHEPPNAFATAIAKYFNNALREETLLRSCTGGIVFLPGAAGTVQEVFEAVTPRYYADADEPIAALILVGTQYWTTTRPVWPLLAELARGRPLAARIHLVDDLDEVPALLLD